MASGKFALRGSCVLIAAVPLVHAGQAQGEAANTAEMTSRYVEEVVVTARKREESIRDVPIAISAFTDRDLENADVRSLKDIAASVPGLQYADQGGQTPGRVDSAIRFRGMHVNSSAPSRQLGSLFLDGVYVLGSTHSVPLDDVQRVEVIKGPQSAYFGRNTFGGAVNYITRTPSLIDYSGKLAATAASYDEYELAASHEGPIVEDRLSYRIGGRSHSRGAMFEATDGGGLGEQSSQSVYLTLYARPTDALTAKFRVLYGEDDDGPAAGGLVAGIQNDSCTGRSFVTEAGEAATPRRYVCGAVPGIGSAQPIQGVGRIVDANTGLFPQRAAAIGTPDILVSQLINRPLPSQYGDVPDLDGFGLRRDLLRVSLAADYEFAGGYVASAQVAYSDLAQLSVRDYAPSAFENWFVREARSQSDRSIEVRVASPGDRKLRWVTGVNAYTQDYWAPNNNGDVVALCIDTFNTVTDPANNGCLPISFLLNHDANNDAVETIGLFAAATYDFTDQWGVSVEGRYQKDENTQGATRRLTAQYTNFLPRFIMQYRPTPATNLYASYSIGVLPGAVNQRVVDATPQELAQYKALFADAGGYTEEEELTSYELGWKQSLLNGRLNFALAAYYGDWENQKSQVSAVINETCQGSRLGSAGCRPALGEGAPGQVATNPDGTLFYNARGLAISGTSKIYGVEFESQFVVNDRWSGGLNFGYAGSEYTDFQFLFVQSIAGFSDMKGNSNPRFPDWSASINTTYERQLTGDMTFFGRGDVFYTGRTFADESNLAYCKDYVTVNARAGIEKNDLRLEAFVRNLFNEDAWAACARWTDFENPSKFPAVTADQGIAVTPLDKRQFGLRMSYKF